VSWTQTGKQRLPVFWWVPTKVHSAVLFSLFQLLSGWEWPERYKFTVIVAIKVRSRLRCFSQPSNRREAWKHWRLGLTCCEGAESLHPRRVGAWLICLSLTLRRRLSMNSFDGSSAAIWARAFSASLNSTDAIAGKSKRFWSNNPHCTCTSSPKFGITLRDAAISDFNSSLLVLKSRFVNAIRAFVCARSARSDGVRAFVSRSGRSSSASSHWSRSKYAAAKELPGLNRSPNHRPVSALPCSRQLSR
jgi:hypothetical protein